MSYDAATQSRKVPSSKPQHKLKLVQVGNYKLMSLRLGEGASSKVELASHTILKTKVAMKVLSLKDIKDPYVIKHMERESKIMASLVHPNVARLFEVQSHREYFFLMMELYPGGDLLDHLTLHVRLPEYQARDIYRQVIRGLEYIHSRGVIHRDIKLENIMMDKKRSRVVIADFGLSNVMRAGKVLRTRCGTEEYAAPELLDINTNYDKEVDIWSSGVVLYTMLVGERPFYSTTSTTSFLKEIKQGLRSDHHDALKVVCCSQEGRDLLANILTTVEVRLRGQEILSHDWLNLGDPAGPPPAQGLDHDQELQVAKSIKTRLNLLNWSPAQILAYVKSSDGKWGKTAGCFNILSREMEEAILEEASQQGEPSRKVLSDVSLVAMKSAGNITAKKENDLPRDRKSSAILSQKCLRSLKRIMKYD